MIIVEFLVCIVLFLLAVMGLTGAVRALSVYVLGEKRRHLLSVVFLDGTDTEYTLRCAIGMQSVSAAGSGRIYAVDCGMNGENRRIAQAIARRHPSIMLVELSEFTRMAQDLDFEEYRIKAG